jgi:DNA/RNA endonuclease YhcR with UshA esterase domain
MRMLVVASSFALLTTQAFAETIMPSDASSHVGEHVTVEGIVTEVHHAASGRAAFLNMGGRYPNNVFTAVIFADDAPKFPGIDLLQGKTVDITGTITLYKKRPEIILNDAQQIKIK